MINGRQAKKGLKIDCKVSLAWNTSPSTSFLSVALLVIHPYVYFFKIIHISIHFSVCLLQPLFYAHPFIVILAYKDVFLCLLIFLASPTCFYTTHMASHFHSVCFMIQMFPSLFSFKQNCWKGRNNGGRNGGKRGHILVAESGNKVLSKLHTNLKLKVNMLAQ